jgi:HEAT repeat protein
LLADPDAGVRACAAEALGAVPQAGLLTTLQKLLTDSDPIVRSSASVSLARGCRATGRRDLARNWLASLHADADERVRSAVAAARDLLDAAE